MTLDTARARWIALLVLCLGAVMFQIRLNRRSNV